MEPEVKERLVGAVILVLLAVLVVPALLSGPQQSEPAQPRAAASSRSVEIDLGGTRTAEPVEITTPDETVPGSPPALVREAPSGLPDGDVPAAAATPGPAPAASAEPAAVTAPAARQAAAAVAAGFAVQVAALSNRDAAAQQVVDLERRGYSAFIVEYRSGGRVLYRVRVGPEAARERAVALAARLKAEGIGGNVVSQP